ncbi:MAG: hypothetical protein KatS3mg002_1064 [Candidatus Woesearchaeota archaeon]|nr:MAG: hypothetical protein KatS3mg002_1064 [Candidatus Woesearchaeota archaeon]
MGKITSTFPVRIKRKRIKKHSEITEEKRNRLIDWVTFYRRNIHRFIEHYFQIKLYPYQVFWIYYMNIMDTFVAIASRAVGKTWLLAVFASAKAVLYPNSEIVVVSSTKEQAGNLVDKITDLSNNYPNLYREISNITTNLNRWEVDFHNGSKIKVVASRDSSRGKRSTFTIYEEFRLIDKNVIDTVIRPFSYVRQPPYLKLPEYSHLIEEPKEVFISSAYHKALWWYDETKKTISAMLKGDNSGFLACDYEVSLRHKIKTIRKLKSEIDKMDEVAVLEEYYNIPYGENSNSYFKLKMFERLRNIKRAFYPITDYTITNPRKNPFYIPKVDGEIRLISTDVAQRGGKENDLSINSLIRLLPTHKGFIRELLYMESYSGINSLLLSLRIKQLFYDFEANYIVLDISNAGITIYDQLGTLTKDADRGLEYLPMTVISHPAVSPQEYKELYSRTTGTNALEVIFPYVATADRNAQMAVQMRDKLQKRMFSFLVDEVTAEDYYLKDLKKDENISSYLAPHVQTSLFINESIGLSLTYLSSGVMKLKEISTRRKDRYSSVAMGNYFAGFLDSSLIREDSEESDLESLLSVTYFS